MQTTFQNLASIFLFILSFSYQADAQKLDTNDQGVKIIVFDDGSWRYYEAVDSAMFIKREDPRRRNERKKIGRDSSLDPLPKADSASKSHPDEDDFFVREDVQTASPFEVPVTTGNTTTNESIKFEKTKKRKTRISSTGTSVALQPVEKTDYLISPPSKKCNIAFSGIDEYTKRKRVEMEKEVLFSFTDPEVAVHLRGIQYLTCEANFNEFVGDIRILSIKVIINSRTARAEYGYMPSGTLFSIKLLNGETVTLFSNNSDMGQIDVDKNSTTYKVNFPISRENQKLLQKSLVDKIKIVWSTGYEEYNVANLDFFQNQINCLDNQ